MHRHLDSIFQYMSMCTSQKSLRPTRWTDCHATCAARSVHCGAPAAESSALPDTTAIYYRIKQRVLRRFAPSFIYCARRIQPIATPLARQVARSARCLLLNRQHSRTRRRFITEFTRSFSTCMWSSGCLTVLQLAVINTR